MGNVTAGQLIVGGAIAYLLARDVKADEVSEQREANDVSDVSETNKTEGIIVPEQMKSSDESSDVSETNTSDSEEKVSE